MPVFRLPKDPIAITVKWSYKGPPMRVLPYGSIGRILASGSFEGDPNIHGSIVVDDPGADIVTQRTRVFNVTIPSTQSPGVYDFAYGVADEAFTIDYIAKHDKGVLDIRNLGYWAGDSAGRVYVSFLGGAAGIVTYPGGVIDVTVSYVYVGPALPPLPRIYVAVLGTNISQAFGYAEGGSPSVAAGTRGHRFQIPVPTNTPLGTYDFWAVAQYYFDATNFRDMLTNRVPGAVQIVTLGVFSDLVGEVG